MLVAEIPSSAAHSGGEKKQEDFLDLAMMNHIPDKNEHAHIPGCPSLPHSPSHPPLSVTRHAAPLSRCAPLPRDEMPPFDSFHLSYLLFWECAVSGHQEKIIKGGASKHVDVPKNAPVERRALLTFHRSDFQVCVCVCVCVRAS